VPTTWPATANRGRPKPKHAGASLLTVGGSGSLRAPMGSASSGSSPGIQTRCRRIACRAGSKFFGIATSRVPVAAGRL